MYNLNNTNSSEYRIDRNFRERHRVRKISHVFEELKGKLPEEWTSRKMSKAEILRKTIKYIRYLANAVHEQINTEEKKDNHLKELSFQMSENYSSAESICSNFTNHRNNELDTRDSLLQWIDSACASDNVD